VRDHSLFAVEAAEAGVLLLLSEEAPGEEPDLLSEEEVAGLLSPEDSAAFASAFELLLA
jgi:hypothetical protein